MTVPPVPGLTVVGGVIVMTGPVLRTALDAVLIAGRSRRLSGLPDSSAYTGLAEALLRASAAGHSDVPEPAPAQCFPVEPTVLIEEAADMLKLSRRQTRRIAGKLGGRIIRGQWLLDQTAITEHIEGRHP